MCLTCVALDWQQVTGNVTGSPGWSECCHRWGGWCLWTRTRRWLEQPQECHLLPCFHWPVSHIDVKFHIRKPHLILKIYYYVNFWWGANKYHRTVKKGPWSYLLMKGQRPAHTNSPINNSEHIQWHKKDKATFYLPTWWEEHFIRELIKLRLLLFIFWKHYLEVNAFSQGTAITA